MTYDSRCYDLAKSFLSDLRHEVFHNPDGTEYRLSDRAIAYLEGPLAQSIQNTIDGFLRVVSAERPET